MHQITFLLDLSFPGHPLCINNISNIWSAWINYIIA